MDPEADLFRRGKEVLGKKAGGLIAKLYRANHRNINQTRRIIETAATKENPHEYIGRVLNPLQDTTQQRPTTLSGGASGEYYRV